MNSIHPQPAGGSDFDRLFFAGSQIFSRKRHNAVGVNVKGHFNLGHAPKRRRNIDQIKPAQCLIPGCHFALTLKHINENRRLAIRGR